MALAVKIQPIDRDVALIAKELQSPEVFAQAAQEAIKEADETNRLVLGRKIPKRVFVDGVQDAPIASVRSIVVAEWELLGDLFQFIVDSLQRHSPVKTGRFKNSHTIFADGVEVALGEVIPDASEYVIMSALPYARKIERGESPQAPEGVFGVVAAEARRRYSNIAKITDSFRTPIGGFLIGGRIGDRAEERNPAIIVRLR